MLQLYTVQSNHTQSAVAATRQLTNVVIERIHITCVVHVYIYTMYVCVHVCIIYTVPFYMFPVTIAYLVVGFGFACFVSDFMRATIIGSNSLLKDSSRQNGYTYILDAPPISVHIHDFMRLIHELRRVIPHKLLHTLTNTTYTALQIHETNRH